MKINLEKLGEKYKNLSHSWGSFMVGMFAPLGFIFGGLALAHSLALLGFTKLVKPFFMFIYITWEILYSVLFLLLLARLTIWMFKSLKPKKK